MCENDRVVISMIIVGMIVRLQITTLLFIRLMKK